MKKLLVIIPDRLSDLVAKGEITARYYNPGDLFDEVHILMINDDRADAEALKPMVGRARLVLHNLPAERRMFLTTLMWRPWLLRRWAAAGVAIARQVQPSLVRCHANLLNGFVASEIKRELGIPYVVSLHINPDEDLRGRARSWKTKVTTKASEAVERAALAGAAMVLPVYEPIVPYLRRLGVQRYEVLHNVINPTALRIKESYRLHNPARIISVGRLIPQKFPANLIRSIKGLDVTLTVVGDGSAAEALRQVAIEEAVMDRTEFVPSMPNDQLCATLADYDIFATHSEYFEISKSVLEPLLTGLPTILNKRQGRPVPELQGDFIMLVDNTVDGYRGALTTLLDDHAFRESLGRRACKHAQEHWAPSRMERRVVEIYETTMKAAVATS